jgi:hypothetical protein
MADEKSSSAITTDVDRRERTITEGLKGASVSLQFLQVWTSRPQLKNQIELSQALQSSVGRLKDLTCLVLVVVVVMQLLVEMAKGDLDQLQVCQIDPQISGRPLLFALHMLAHQFHNAL